MVNTPLKVTHQFTRLYIFALLGVALLSIIGQVLVQFALQSHLNDSWVINNAGRQRFQSQLMVKNMLLLTQTKIPIDTSFYLANLKTVLGNWEDYHQILKNGKKKEKGIMISNSDTIKHLFAAIDKHFYLVSTHLKKVIAFLEKGEKDEKVMLSSIPIILENELAFLNKMDMIVFQYDTQARAKVERLQKIEFFLILCTLFILLLEGFFVFRPAVNTLKKIMLQLIDSEQKKTKINQELYATNEQLTQSNQLLEATREELVQATEQRYLQELHEHKIRSMALLQGQEEERKRISRELHDGIGQTLTVMKLLSEKVKNTDSLPEKEKTAFLELKSMVFTTIQEIRNISHDLMPTVLGDFGLASALKDLVERYAQHTEAKINLQTILHEKRFDKILEISIFRIAQEALTNAVKHANASEIELKVVQKNNYLLFLLVDNGVGFQIREEKSKNYKNNSNISHGLQNMKQRANLINARLKVFSTVGKGTKVVMRLGNFDKLKKT